MDCTLSDARTEGALDEAQLIRFHFGTCEFGEKTAVELHLSRCPACLGRYFALKAEFEGMKRQGSRSEDAQDAPDSALRARVMASFRRHNALQKKEKHRRLTFEPRSVAFGMVAGLIVFWIGFAAIESGWIGWKKDWEEKPSAVHTFFDERPVDSGGLTPQNIHIL